MIATLKENSSVFLPGAFELANLLTHQAKLKNTVRFKKFYEVGMCIKQTSYDHSMELIMTAIRVVMHIFPYNPNLDILAVVLGTALHDHGEIEYDTESPGDISFTDKLENNNHRIGELKVFSKLLDNVTRENKLFKDNILPYYLLQYSGNINNVEKLLENAGLQDYQNSIFRHKKLEARVFDAIERLGYIIFPYQGFLSGHPYGLEFFLTILKSHYNKLLEYSRTIKGFDYFYSETDHKNIEVFIANNKNVEDADVIADRLLEEIVRKKDFMNNEV